MLALGRYVSSHVIEYTRVLSSDVSNVYVLLLLLMMMTVVVVVVVVGVSSDGLRINRDVSLSWSASLQDEPL